MKLGKTTILALGIMIGMGLLVILNFGLMQTADDKWPHI